MRPQGLVNKLIVGCGVLASALILASCSSNNSSAIGQRGKSPGWVALTYVKDLYSGKFSNAERLVTPSQRNIFQLAVLGIKPHSVSSYNLKIGSVSFVKTTASVILTGRLCSTGNTRSLSEVPSGKHCISNSNPHSNDPAFDVRLSSSLNGTFAVTFQH